MSGGQLTPEQRELFRIAARSALQWSDGGRKLQAEARREAKHWAAIKPLGRPLSTGEPVSAPQHTQQEMWS